MSQTELHTAAYNGDIVAVQIHLCNGANIQVENRHGDTSLHLAALRGHIQVFELLLQNGAKKESRNKNGETPLHKACLYGQVAIVEMLLRESDEENPLDKDGNTPLHCAALQGHESVIKLLAEKKFNLNVTNNSKQTPLHVAISSGNEYAATILQEMGSDIQMKDDNENSALHLAVISGSIKTTEMLLRNGAELESHNKQKHTPLHLATIEGNLSLIKTLTEAGADLYNLNFSGNTGAHHAAFNGKFEVMELILGLGFDINFKNKKNNTVLHHAVFNENIKLVEFLLEKKCHVEVKNVHGETPLHASILKGNIPLIEKLIRAGGNMDNMNNTGNTGAHHAAFNGRCEVAKFLINHGFDVNFQNVMNNTMLHLAAREGHINLVRLLLTKGANPNMYNDNGNTPAHLASRLGYTDIAIELLEAGADVCNPKTSWSLLHTAALGNRLHTIQELVTKKYLTDKDLTVMWQNQTPYVCADIIGSSDSSWWLRKQQQNNSQNETSSTSYLRDCRNHYEKSGSETMKFSKISSRRERSWVEKSIKDGQAELHYMDESGDTPLHAAVMSNNPDTAKVLVEAGALLVARNHKSLTPTDIDTSGILKEYRSNYENVQIEGRVGSRLYTALLNIIAQTVNLEVSETRAEEQSHCTINLDKKIQNMKLEAVAIVSKILSLGVSHDPPGSNHCHLLPLAITTNNRTLLPILLAAGLPLTTSDSGLGIVQLAWLTPDITTWVGMIVTRAVTHRLETEHKILVMKMQDTSQDFMKKILSQDIKSLVKDLHGEKPWEAKFRNQSDVPLTELFVVAGAYGCTLTAWYIWMAGANVFDRVEPSCCTALEAALSTKHTETAVRMVLDMGANPFLKDTEGRIPTSNFPAELRMTEIMLAQEFRSLEKMMVKIKDDNEKKEHGQIILLLIILFLQHDSKKSTSAWQPFLECVLNAYKLTHVTEMSLVSGTWIDSLIEMLVTNGLHGRTFNASKDISSEINYTYEKVGLKSSSKNYIPEDATDNFYGVFDPLKENFIHMDFTEEEGLRCLRRQKSLYGKALKICCEKPFPLFLHLILTLVHIDIERIVNDVCETRPLHHAARNGNISAVLYLLQCNASPFSADRSGFLPIDYAFMYGHTRTGNIILKNMENNTECFDHEKAYGRYRKAHENYLISYGLNPEITEKSRYLHIHTYDNLLAKRLDSVQKEWEGKGIKKATQDILVNYQEGEAKEVKKSVKDFLTRLKESISQKNNLFEGEIEFVGSSEDNVRLFCPDEYDCNLLLHKVNAYPDGDLRVSLVNLNYQKKVSCGHSQTLEVFPVSENLKTLMKGSNFLKEFYRLARESLRDMDLSNLRGLKIMMPGIKTTQVGINLCFLWEGDTYPMLFIDIDFVPTVKAPWPKDLPKPCCRLDSRCLEEVYLNNIGKGEWRLSFGPVETKIMQSLSDIKRDVFVVCKMILAWLKTEGWVPQVLKCEFMYWCSRLFSLPSKGGFALKNSFFRELEVTQDEDWTNEKLMKRVCSIFEKMCETEEQSIIGPKPVKAYFGGDTEKASAFLCAPEILKFLNGLDLSIITS